MDMLELQLEFERSFHKNQALSIIKEFIDFDNTDIFDEHNLPINFVTAAIAHMLIIRVCKPSTLIGLTYKYFDNKQECADAIQTLVKLDYIDYDLDQELLESKWKLSKEVQERFELFQFPLPHVYEPKTIKHNMMNGFYSEYLNTGSVILKDNHTNEDINLDHINKVNKIPLSINIEAVQHIKNNWKGVNKRKPNEPIEKYKAKVKAFNKYNREVDEVIKSLLLADNKFYLTNKYDKRGRCYSVGYHVNLQGNDFNKASIEFHEKEKLND